MPSQDETLDESLSGVADLYTESLSEHGPVSKSVGWKDESSQRLRFAKLTEVLVNDHRQEISISDWGCGYGGMFPYLAELLGDRLGSYSGYDLSKEMVAAARNLVDDPRATFHLGSELLHETDYSFVSGTFNVKLGAPANVWCKHVEETLLLLAAASRRGFAFNLLTSHVDWKEDHLYYADPAHFFDFCKRRIARYVTLLHDYPLFEWTILVRKDSEPS